MNSATAQQKWVGYPQNQLGLSSLRRRARMEDPTESPTRGQCRRALGASKQLWGFSWSHPRPLVTRMRNRLNITSQHSQHNARHRWLDFPGSPPPGTNSQRHPVCVCVCVRAHSRQPNSKSAVDNTGGSLVLRITFQGRSLTLPPRRESWGLGPSFGGLPVFCFNRFPKGLTRLLDRTAIPKD